VLGGPSVREFSSDENITIVQQKKKSEMSLAETRRMVEMDSGFFCAIKGATSFSSQENAMVIRTAGFS
jgi:hypothetical protein